MRKRALKYLVGGTAGAAAVVLLTGGVAFAQDDDPIAALGGQLNMLWVVIGAVLVIFMQAGFALVETGFCRAKHAAHVVSTNFAIFGLAFIGFFLVGFPLCLSALDMSGYFGGLGAAVGSPLLGDGNWVFLWKGGWAMSGGGIDAGVLAIFLYMVAFMDTTATIPTGRDGRTVEVGELRHLGTVLRRHLLPAVRGVDVGRRLAGQDVGHVRPRRRLRRLRRQRSGARRRRCRRPRRREGARRAHREVRRRRQAARALLGHNIPMAILGTFILLFGWFGFNAASTFAATDVQFATVATNTAIAAAFGAIIAMFWITRRTGKPDPGMMANGMLAGLVAITAPCAFVTPAMAAVIGAIAGVLVIEAVYFIERRLKVDDPVGAIAVHGVCGTFGVLAVGLFANGSYGGGWNGSDVEGVKGLFWGDAGQLGAQLLGAVVLWTVIFGIAYAFFRIQDSVSKAMGKGGIRSKEADEITGLDVPEMGVPAYPEFAAATHAVADD